MLSKPSDVAKNEVVKKILYAELVKIFNVIPSNDTSYLVKKDYYNAKLLEIEKKIPNHHKYITTYGLNKFSGAILSHFVNQHHISHKHPTSPTSHIPNIPQPKFPTSHVPDMPHLEDSTSQTHQISNIPQPVKNIWLEKTVIGLQ